MLRTVTGIVLALLWLGGCVQTTIDRSARKQDPVKTWETQLARAKRFHKSGFQDSASRHYDLALETARGFPRGDERLIETLSLRAELRLARGQYEFAERDFREILELRRFNAEGPDGGVANELNNLAVFYIDLGRLDEASRLLEEAIAIRAALYGPDHVFVAVLAQNLGDLKRRQGNFDRAEQLLTSALTIYAQNPSADEFWGEAAIAQNNLARVYRATGRVEDAERNHLDAIRLSMKGRGERNPDIGVFSRDLANLYTDERRFAEAERLYSGSISILGETVGASSYQISKTYRDYARMLEAAGRRGDAARLRARADQTGF